MRCAVHGLGWLLLLSTGCIQDPHPEYRHSYAMADDAGPVIVVIDYALVRDSDGSVDESDNGLRTLRVATGELGLRRRTGRINTHCAPARAGAMWCNGEPSATTRRIELRNLSDLSVRLDDRDLVAASGGRLDQNDITWSGIEVTPDAHELIVLHRDDATGTNTNFAVDPEALAFRVFDALDEPAVESHEFSYFLSEVHLGDADYGFETGVLTRYPHDGSAAEPLDPAQVYDQPVLLRADPFASGIDAMSAGAPDSVFVLELGDGELRVSRVRIADGGIEWTHTDRLSHSGASAMANGVLALVRVFPFDPLGMSSQERDIEIIGLDVATGEVRYRVVLPDGPA